MTSKSAGSKSACVTGSFCCLVSNALFLWNSWTSYCEDAHTMCCSFEPTRDGACMCARCRKRRYPVTDALLEGMRGWLDSQRSQPEG